MIITNLENKEVYNPFADLEELKNNWTDEIPSEIIHDNGNFKVRKNWWVALVGTLYYLAEDKKIPEELVKEVKKFNRKFSGISNNFGKRPTTAEDIAEANALIDKVLESQK